MLVRERRDPNRGAESKKRKDPCISDRGAPYRRSHRKVLVEAFPQPRSQLTKSLSSDLSFFNQLGHALGLCGENQRHPRVLQVLTP